MAVVNVPKFKSSIYQGRDALLLLSGEFNDLMIFFNRLFLKAKKANEKDEKLYIVFKSRRCWVLMNIVWDIWITFWDNDQQTALEKELKATPGSMNRDLYESIWKSKFITDTAFSTMAEKLCMYYHETNQFPEIILADEMLIYGRAVNAVISNMEKQLLKEYLKIKAGDAEKSNNILTTFRSKLEIYVYAQNEKNLLLLPEYVEKLHSEKTLDTVALRRLSCDFTDIAETSTVNNVSFSWSFRDQTELPESYFDSSKYRYLRTYIRSKREDNFIYLYPDRNHIKAICTLRMKESDLEGSQRTRLAVPFIILDHLKRKNILNLGRKLADENAGCKLLEAGLKKLSTADNSKEDASFADYNRVAQLCELYLNALLVLDFNQSVQTDNIVLNKDSLHYWQLVPNFVNFSSEDPEAEYRNVETQLKNIWIWAEGAIKKRPDALEFYLGVLLKDTSGFSNTSLYTGELPDWNLMVEKNHLSSLDDAGSLIMG